MIRMGRGSKPDHEASDIQPAAAAENSYRYQQQPATSAPAQAISESDSMARDIKEGRLSGFVGHGTTLSGETEFQAMLRVDGHLVGSVTSETGTLIVGANGQVDANVMVAAATVNGTINGDVLATERLHLGRTARVLGNIQAPRLIVEEGAILEGSVSMLKARETQEEEVAASVAHAAPEPESLPYSLASDEGEDISPSSYLADEDDDHLENDDEPAAEAANA